MKKAMLVVLLTALLAMAYAGIDEFYSFSASTTTYAPITGTTIDGISTDDALSDEIQIGFTFPYGDLSFTSLKVSSNGWVGLGNQASGSNLSNDIAITAPFPYIAPLWDDTSLSGGVASYALSGTAPNRIFTVQYQNLSWNYSGDNQHNFQILLYENGKIDFVYGSATGTPNNPSASIGITMPPGGTTWFYSINLTSPVTYSTATAQNGISTFPAAGTVFSFIPVVAAANDLVAMSITGNLTPSMNAPTIYNVQVRNRGTAAQTTYSVNLVNSTGTVLATMPGNTIQPNEIQTYPISWTPTVEGPVAIRGQVVLAGDANPQNDQTSILNITVMPAGLLVVTVGAGGEQALMPVDMYYRNSLYENIYFANEMTGLGNITALAFYNNFVTNLPNMPTKIWLGTTTAQDLSAGWIPSTQLTLVYDGNVNYPSGQNTILIPLQTIFTYTGGNLVMLVNRPMDTQYYNYNDRFDSQTVGTTRALRYSSDGTLLDPAAPPQTSPIGQFPKTSFYLTPLSPDPLFMVNPASVSFGQVLMNSSHNATVRVMNAGGGTLGINSVSISGSPFFTLSGLPTLPQNLNTGQNLSITVNYIPTAAGEHTATITIVDALTRQVHTVPITGNALDSTIYTLPYMHNFDDVTAPAIPITWSKIVQAATPNSYLVSQTGTVVTAPNAIQMYNYDDMASNLLLVSPVLANNLNVPAMRIKFRARASSANMALSVGIMTDPQSAATFTEVASVNCNTEWAQLVVPFTGYTGTGRYIAFKHGNTSTYTSIYIDNFELEYVPVNDIAAIGITGNATPSSGSQSIYTVSVYNWGTATQTNYQVKLYNPENIEVGSSPGLSVGAGATVQVQVAWTPTGVGDYYIYAKTVLTGDENNLNDQSPNFNVIIQPTGTLSITVGDGSQLGRYPVDMFWRNSLFETIYYTQEMGLVGTINSLSFYNNFTQNLPNMPTKIWLGITQQQDLSAGWIPSGQLTLVFDGTVNYPIGTNAIVIPLQTPFNYTGGNLVMLVNRPMDTQYYNSSNNFATQQIGNTRSRNIQSDSTLFDPAAPPDGSTLSGNFPKTTFQMTPLSDEPVFLISPENRNFGTVLLNTSHSQSFTVINAGGGPLVINSANLAGSPYYTVQNMPAMPVTLSTGQSFQFTVSYNPTAVGEHAATITFDDNMPTPQRSSARSRQTHIVNLSANCIDATISTLPYLQNFDAVTAPALPVTWSRIIQGTGTPGTVTTNTSTAQSAPNSVALTTVSDTAATLILIAPPLANTFQLPTMRTKFYARGSDNYLLDIGVMTDPQNPGTFSLVQQVSLSANWTQYVVPFVSYTGTGHYIAFRHGGGTYRSIYVDDVLFEITPQNDLAALSITGNTTPNVGMATNYAVTVFNWGTNTQSNYQVKLYTAGDVEVGSAAGTAVPANQSVTVPVSWTPTTEGPGFIYAKTVLTGDQNTINDQSPNFNVNVFPAGLVNLTIGTGTENALLPINFYWMNSLFEMVIPATELGGTLGIIQGLNFYNNFTQASALDNMPTKVWLGTTTQPDLSTGWIPSTELTLVFDGNVNYPAGENTINIPFITPYLYLNGQNLVVMVQRPMDTQYYSSMSYFKCSTTGTTRTRHLYSDGTAFDPANPEEGTLTGQFPMTTLLIIPGGVGHLNGTIRNAANQPMPGVQVQLLDSDYSTITNAQGQYSINNIIADDYDIIFSKHGYQNLSFPDTEIEEDITLTLDGVMIQLPLVNVTGTVLASDTGSGINGAAISLTGYESYNANTNATGAFTIPGVYANQTYNYTIMNPGYSPQTGSITVGATNHSMGNITLAEMAYPPRDVLAEVTTTNQAVNIHWLPPDPNAQELTEGFESNTFPPLGWTQNITNTGAANANGVFPTWCRFGTITIGTSTVAPTQGEWQAGLWWSYEHQDEWLITPTFFCPPQASLSFDSYVFLGSTSGDHYYIKASVDNGTNWTVLWDASAQTGGWNYYATPILVDLSAYAGQEVKLAWHAVDPPSNDGLWYTWFIDNVYIGNDIDTIRFAWAEMQMRSQRANRDNGATIPNTAPSRAIEQGIVRREAQLPSPNTMRYNGNSERSLVGYRVWRLASGQEANPNNWTLLTPNTITNPAYTDLGWGDINDGAYLWAVRSVYTNDLMSSPSFSNSIVYLTQTGMISGVVRTPTNQPIPGAAITAGTYTATTNNSGAYVIVAETGVYNVTAAANGFQTQTISDVVVYADQTTTVNFVMVIGSDNNDPNAPVTETRLVGNIPNPFNPSTTIKYDVLDAGPVRIEIYNQRGQLVKRLVNETKSAGHHSTTWEGNDEQGRTVSSGIYYYKMFCGSYSSTRKMVLMK